MSWTTTCPALAQGRSALGSWAAAEDAAARGHRTAHYMYNSKSQKASEEKSTKGSRLAPC